MKESGARLLVDWGTTNLRAFLVDVEGGLLERQVSDKGILNVAPEDMPALLDSLAVPWRDRLGGAPAVLCGMVGSVNGWVEVPYLSCPASMEDLPEGTRKVTSAAGREAFILPGLTHHRRLAGDLMRADVMRGEETQIFGALRHLKRNAATFCLPGTHAKWARVEDECCTDFATYFTGELYSVLTRHSLLGRLMEKPDGGPEAVLPEGFERGLQVARTAEGLSGSLFSARADVLAGFMTEAESPGYLSGLLIGFEVREALPRFGPAGPIIIVGAHALVPLYRAALRHSGVTVEELDGETAVIAGLLQASERLEI